MAKKLTRAEENIKWCEENLCIPDGKFVGQPLKVAGKIPDRPRLDAAAATVLQVSHWGRFDPVAWVRL
jgi:hypothetical protein